MGLTRVINRPVGILYKALCSLGNGGYAYSSSISQKGICSMTALNYGQPVNLFGTSLVRHYSDLSAGDQMNLIKKLREATSAPIKDVKSALVASNWDVDAAQKDLRKRGVVLASKKSSRTAAEGLLALAQNQQKAVVVELNCETDFVARNDIFQNLVLSLAKSALLLERSKHDSIITHVNADHLEDLKMNFVHPKFSGEKTVQSAITEVAGMVGENVKLGGGVVIPAPSYGVLSTYLHNSPQPGIGRIAGVLSLEVENKTTPLEAVQQIGSELAMHIVAAKPLFLTREDVSSDALGNEQEILRSQAESTGKSQMAIDKMVEGRLKKYFEDVVLLEQKFVVDDTVNIKTVLSNLSKQIGSEVKIANFARVEVGQGLKRPEGEFSPNDDKDKPFDSSL